MKIAHLKAFLVIALFFGAFLTFSHTALAQANPTPTITGIQVNETQLGFKIPTLGDILTFAIRAFFVIAGITALIFLLLGAFSWITSGGDKEEVGKAQQKIQAALLGVILIAVVLALVVTMEQVIFKATICFGISCPVKIPGLVKPCKPAWDLNNDGRCSDDEIPPSEGGTRDINAHPVPLTP